MELIKKIKETEAQAQEIIDRAKADTVRLAEEGRKKRLAVLSDAEQQRKRAIQSALAAARSQGLAEAQKLKEQARKERQGLRQKAEGKIAAAAARVMDYLKS
jgi:V/A-type H+-transporting ATPase subunit G/H